MTQEIEVPSQLLKPHPLVAQFKEAARTAREDKGVLVLNYDKVLRVRTSAAQLRRALILMDTLIKQLERRGHSVQIGGRGKETELVLAEGQVSFRLDERTTRTAPPSPPSRTRRKGRTELEVLAVWRPSHVMLPTGEFSLEFGRYRLGGCKSVWKDRPGMPLERQLKDVLAAVPSWEAALRIRRLEEEGREVRAQEFERQRVERARIQEVLRLQRTALVRNVRSWERAERLRRFLMAAEAKLAPTDETLVWMEWTKSQIEALDPLSSDSRAVTGLDVEISQYFNGHATWQGIPKDWWTD